MLLITGFSCQINQTYHYKAPLGVGPVLQNLILPVIKDLLRLGTHSHNPILVHAEKNRFQTCALKQLPSWLLIIF